jgi:hypothetical protein
VENFVLGEFGDLSLEPAPNTESVLVEDQYTKANGNDDTRDDECNGDEPIEPILYDV